MLLQKENLGKAHIKIVKKPPLFKGCFELGEKSLGQTIDQDTAVFILQQHGLRSRGFNRAYFAGQEKRIRRFHEMIESYFE